MKKPTKPTPALASRRAHAGPRALTVEALATITGGLTSDKVEAGSENIRR